MKIAKRCAVDFADEQSNTPSLLAFPNTFSIPLLTFLLRARVFQPF
jgi:hypothetical protein